MKLKHKWPDRRTIMNVEMSFSDERYNSESFALRDN